MANALARRTSSREFARELARLHAGFPQREWNDLVVQLYYDRVGRRFPPVVIEQAVSRALDEGLFFPTIAELIEFCKDTVDQLVRAQQAPPAPPPDLSEAVEGPFDVRTLVADLVKRLSAPWATARRRA